LIPTQVSDKTGNQFKKTGFRAGWSGIQTRTGADRSGVFFNMAGIKVRAANPGRKGVTAPDIVW